MSISPLQNFPKRPPGWLGNITGSPVSSPPWLPLGDPRDCGCTGQSCLGASGHTPPHLSEVGTDAQSAGPTPLLTAKHHTHKPSLTGTTVNISGFWWRWRHCLGPADPGPQCLPSQTSSTGPSSLPTSSLVPHLPSVVIPVLPMPPPFCGFHFPEDNVQGPYLDIRGPCPTLASPLYPAL